MRLKIKFIFLLCILLLETSYSEIIARYGDGFLEQRDGLLVLYVSGTPYDMGFQHGKLLKEKINSIIAVYIDGQVSKIITQEMFLAAAKKVEKYILPEFIEEMKGIADGAEIPYEKILHSHIFLDLFVNPNQQKLRKMLFQCSNFAAFGDATKNKKLIHGRNLDWWDWGVLKDYAVIIFCKPDRGNAYVSVGWTGGIGVLTGMNEKQISIGQMVIKGTENSVEGVPHFFLLREVIQYANTLDDAEKIIKDAKRTTCWNVLIADGKIPDASLIEYTAQNFAILKPKDGVLYSTNHFVSDILKGQMKTYPPTEHSIARYIRLGQLFKEWYGRIDKDRAIKFLGDHFNPIENKETPHNNTICQASNIQSVVFLPQSLEFYVSAGIPSPVAHGKYHYFDFKKEIKK